MIPRSGRVRRASGTEVRDRGDRGIAARVDADDAQEIKLAGKGEDGLGFGEGVASVDGVRADVEVGNLKRGIEEGGAAGRKEEIKVQRG